MTPLLIRAGIRYFLTHPVQTAVNIIGIALGVATVLAIDLANHSALRAFEISSETVAGKATHSLRSTEGNVPEKIYVDLRTQLGMQKAAPVIESFATLNSENGSLTLSLLGIDPFSEAPFRTFANDISVPDGSAFEYFLAQPLSCFLLRERAMDLGLDPGDALEVRVQSQVFTLTLAGYLEAEDDDLSQSALRNMLIVDISTAQHLNGMHGELSRVDLVLAEEKEKELRQWLPEGLNLESASSEAETKKKMTEAFRINLAALSLLGLVVGMFLIYQTMTFSVIQRFRLFGRLRTSGVLGSEIFQLILLESLVLAIIGIIVGLAGGIVLAKQLLVLVTRTVSDLYFVNEVNELSLNALLVAKALFLGLAATLISAYFPAREASRAKPGILLSRNRQQQATPSTLLILFLSGLGFFALSGLILGYSGSSIPLSYLAVLLLLVGFSMCVPLVIHSLVNVSSQVLRHLVKGSELKMALGAILRSVQRVSVAVVALSVAISAFVGISVMVFSFRDTVVLWLEQILQADVYVSPPNLTQRQSDGFLPQNLADSILLSFGDEHVGRIHRSTLLIDEEKTNIAVIAIPERARNTYVFKKDSKKAWKKFEEGQAFVSEPYAFRTGKTVGDTLELQFEERVQRVPIAAEYLDYASDLGTVVLHRNFVDQFKENPVTGITIYRKAGESAEDIIEKIQTLQQPSDQILIRENTRLLAQSIEVFDRTFAITFLLQFLMAGVAAAGVFSALLAMEYERKREFGVLKAIGFVNSQIARLSIYEAGVIGIISSVLAIPLGLLLAYILVFVINQRSFGWTLNWNIDPMMIAGTMLIGFFSALLAGAFPAYSILKQKTSSLLREE